MVTMKPQGFKKELPQAKAHNAVCIGAWYLGVQQTEYKGVKKDKPLMMIRWELEEEMKEGEYAGKHFCVGKKYPVFFSENAGLTKLLKDWLDRVVTQQEIANGFNFDELLGVPARIKVVHSEFNNNTYANIGTIEPMDDDKTPLTADHVYYNDETPDWVKKIQAERLDVPEVQAAIQEAFTGSDVYEGGKAPEPEKKDELPF